MQREGHRIEGKDRDGRIKWREASQLPQRIAFFKCNACQSATAFNENQVHYKHTLLNNEHTSIVNKCIKITK